MSIGKFHILLLHLPIGILFLALTLEWVKHFKWSSISKNAFQFIYAVGAASAIFACISGYILSLNYDYVTSDTDKHFWAGIVTAVLATSIFIASLKEHPMQKWLSLAVGISIVVTGHLGGSLTHGEGFLFPPQGAEKLSSVAVFEVDNVEEAVLYTDIITPILNAKCISCHGPNKIKGRLRMDSPEALLEGGKSRRDMLGSKSELIHRIELPSSNDKHMPPKAKPQLTENEEFILRWWIEQGASFEEKVVETPDAEQHIPIISQAIADSKEGGSLEANIPAFVPDVEVNVPDQATMDWLRNKKLVVLTNGSESPFLEINFVNVPVVNDTIWEKLMVLSKNITRLKMSDTEINSKQLSAISAMENLVTLHLDGTACNDGDLLNINGLGELRFLNLSETSISDAGLLNLTDLPNLQKVYAYDTDVSIDSLSAGPVVIKGGFTLASLETDTLRIK